MNPSIRRCTVALALALAFAAAPAFAAQPPLSPADAHAAIVAENPPQVLDVRTAEEFAAGHVPGAVLIPHDQLATRLAELDRDRPVLVYCRSGRRSTLAETLLETEGFDVRQIDGSWLRWQAEGLPEEKPVAATPTESER
jgi:phage shock protein E